MFIFKVYIQFIIAKLATGLGMVIALEARQFNVAFSYQLTTARTPHDRGRVCIGIWEEKPPTMAIYLQTSRSAPGSNICDLFLHQ